MSPLLFLSLLLSYPLILLLLSDYSPMWANWPVGAWVARYRILARLRSGPHCCSPASNCGDATVAGPADQALSFAGLLIGRL